MCGGCPDGRRRQFDEAGGGRLRFGVAVCPGGDRDGNLLNLLDRHHPCGNEMDQDMGSAREAAIAALPTSHTPRGDTEQLSDTVLCEAERAKCLAEFGRSQSPAFVRGCPWREFDARQEPSIDQREVRP
jgi:hypothetical protein